MPIAAKTYLEKTFTYQGNTYEGITGDLGSQYDVTLTGPIELPNTFFTVTGQSFSLCPMS